MPQKDEFNPEKTIAANANTRPMCTAEPRPHLVVLYPRQYFRQIPLLQGKSVIGRGNEADIRLEDEMISRRDLESTNGTFVDGTLLSTHPKVIESENRLQIGKMVLKIDFKDPSEEAFDRELFEAATTDPLTKIPNRRSFVERALGELACARRKNLYAHAVMCDVDHFKRVNDTWGHQAGDMILRAIAQIFSRNKRESDLFARYGGEEFVFLLTEMSKADALKSAERLRKAVENYRFSFEDKAIPVTISLGVASFKGKDIPTIDAMITAADKYLYYAKDHGRNQVVGDAPTP